MEYAETLIVGAGPVGLFLASELQRRGRECLVIERSNSPAAHSKALAIMPGTMRLFSRADLVSEVLSAANRIEGVRFVTPYRSAFVSFQHFGGDYKYVTILPQWKTQALLEARLLQLGGRVRYGAELAGLKQRAGAVETVIREAAGDTRTMHSRFVVGCDGVHSTVRELARIAFLGNSYPGSALLCDVELRTEIKSAEARVHVHERGVVTMFAMNEGLRRVVVIAPGEHLPEYAEVDWLQERLTQARYEDTVVERVVCSNRFRVQRRLASAMRRENVFLAGDSAHTHSPVGGQGMNIGLHDAWSLAEKLARVACGEAQSSLFDSYERERLAVARGVLRRTDLLTRVLATPSPLLRAARERIVPVLTEVPMIYRPIMRALSLTA